MQKSEENNQSALLQAVQKVCQAEITSAKISCGDVVVFSTAAAIRALLTRLKTQPELAFHQLMDVCVVDYLGKKTQRFEAVYHLLSLTHNHRIRVKIPLDEKEEIPTAIDIYPSAGWWEREAFDMFGVVFKGNENKARILTDYGFEGHPLLKDFPVTGYVQVRYDNEKKKVIQEPVRLEQAYRTFDTLSPWQGMSDAFQDHQKFQKTNKGRS